MNKNTRLNTQLGIDMRANATHFSMQSFVNCYLREASNFSVVSYQAIDADLAPEWIDESIECFAVSELKPLKLPVYFAASYWSLTERHQFIFPAYLRQNNEWIELDYQTLIALVLADIKHRVSSGNTEQESAELLIRILNSRDNMQSYFENSNQAEGAYGSSVDFLQAEQALIIGHPMHPVAKSREGFNTEEQLHYAPETSQGFALHYFLLHPNIACTDSTLQQSTDELIRAEAFSGQGAAPNHLQRGLLNHYPSFQLLPMHPWQADYVAKLDSVKSLMQDGQLISLGEFGPLYYPTSSVRTLFNPHGRFMYKCSLNVAITNSVRKNKYRELLRGIESVRLWQSPLGDEISTKYPSFEPVGDPAYASFKVAGEVLDEASLILRRNPVFQEKDNNISNLAMLCQDNASDSKTGKNRIHTLVTNVAKRHNISLEQAAIKWFDSFLDIAASPVLWIYHHYGIAFEAHQQNTLLKINNDMPAKFYYRDNQGCFYITDFFQPLLEHVPELAQASESCGPVEFVNHHFIYYFFINNIFGLINAFGSARVIDEALLMSRLYSYLNNFKSSLGKESSLIDSLLNDATLPCKGNLLTRFAGLDELEAPVEAQSVYFEIKNPLIDIKVHTEEPLAKAI